MSNPEIAAAHEIREARAAFAEIARTLDKAIADIRHEGRRRRRDCALKIVDARAIARVRAESPTFLLRPRQDDKP